MNWIKYSVEDRKLAGISGFAIILIFISFYMHSKLALFLAVFFLLSAIANHTYLSRAGNGLEIENMYNKTRLFIGGKGQWMFRFRNEGLPILKGELRVYFDHYVLPQGTVEEEQRSHICEVVAPFSIFTRQTKQLTISFSAQCRGNAKIRRVELRVPSLIGFGETVLESKNYFKQQAIVYPSPIPVKGLREQMSVLQGANIVSQSVFEDRLGPLGTRDYVSSDSFNHIHWKASARKQTLQTKLFEKISEKSWNVALNISNGHGITGNLEEYISCMTEFAYFCFHKQIPYSLCMNVRKAGSTPFLFLPKGEGREHLQNVLELLASVSTQSISLPYDHLLSFYSRHISSQPYFLHAGERTAEINASLLQEQKKGTRVFELKIVEDHGVLTQMVLEQERRLPL